MSVIDAEDAWIVPSDDEAGLFFYTPKSPGIARDVNGRPQLNLISAGEGGFLQITADWGLNEVQREEIRDTLARQTGPDGAQIRLEQSRDTVTETALCLGDGAAGWDTLKTSASSGVPPFQSAFSVMLDAGQMPRAERALAGERGFLMIRYEVTRSALRARHETERSESTFESSRETSACGTVQSRSATVSQSFAVNAPDDTRMTLESDAADWGLS